MNSAMNSAFYLQPLMYERVDPMNESDMITVPTGVWETLYANHTSEDPVFVLIGECVGAGSVGRIQPSNDLPHDHMRAPAWLWDRIIIEPDLWLDMQQIKPPVAHTIYLRPRKEATLTETDDPVAMLTTCLSGESGSPSWACLNMGAELVLDCGIFDVIDIHDADGLTISYGRILNADVNLEIVPAVDAAPPPVPRPPTPMPPRETMLFAPPQTQTRGRPNGFVPFSGTGHRLCDPPPPG